MAVNASRSMLNDFHQGCIDETYISITPDRGGEIQHSPYERLEWPLYQQAEKHADPPFLESHIGRRSLPRENKV